MFSVVITTKDRLEYLQRCIDSICNNTVLPLEIIIINDSEVPLLESKIDSKVKLVLVNNITSRGANYSRNLGVETSSCEIVFFIDDDDSVETNSFESRYNLFDNELVGLVYTGTKIVKSNNLDMVGRVVTPHRRSDYYKDLLSFGNIIGPTSCVAVRKLFFVQAGKFDEQLRCRQDYDLWIRLAKISLVKTDSQNTVRYTIHVNSSQISSGHEKFLTASNYIYSKYKTEIDELGLKNKFYSSSYYRIAQVASRNDGFNRMKYAVLSLKCRVNIKSIFLLFIPTFIIKRLHLFT
jgi:glycosyltransferase involved in cell wall biosynthesis